ncbi:D-alanyl-D-alanine carboxypeptidase/D-alanyl-D-alanine-endopeptidase [Christiangramia sp. SM2212]|uniref:D-alanyl-D-alanine carboxypeptidase n=1 Tax=Christiangramia sediminicola TaxID=3073267 RepID=A0ABU1ETX4_9FLAO|nr:D-alanyl-D-alanine carboxypeptidase [Christiangramia sp. SM2212]MDR5591829.1 D-alanyl-D-alanine carboxypeptidase [Christiangramia sp. SM2212]
MNSFIARSILIILFISCISCGPSITRQIKSSSSFEKGFTGIAVYDLEKDEMVYEYNSDKYFTPASNTKILTFYTGLKYLEDSITAFKYNSSADTLYFTTTGDPSFLNDKFENNNSLKFLSETKKELVYVQSNWQGTAQGSGWAWDDYEYSFSAERSAFPIFGNLVTLNYNNSSLKVIPEYFQDSIKIAQSGSGLTRKLDANQFSLNTTKENYSRSVPFRTSEKNSIAILSDILQKRVYVKYDRVLLSELYQTVNSISSDSLYKVMLHESDNLIAEQILLMSALKISDTLNTDIAISEVTEKDFKDLPDKIFWVDGSGLSRYNLITPRSLVQVLKKIIKTTGTEKLKSLLPTTGKEGTLKSFLANEDPFVFAKSGSLRNNYSLSGILVSNKGKTLLFSFMNSNYTITSGELKAEMEKILVSIRNRY